MAGHPTSEDYLHQALLHDTGGCTEYNTEPPTPQHESALVHRYRQEKQTQEETFCGCYSNSTHQRKTVVCTLNKPIELF